MNIDLNFIRQTVEARRDVGKWLDGRPKVGLDVTDVATLCAGYDYLANIIRELTGSDPTSESHHTSMQITYLDLT